MRTARMASMLGLCRRLWIVSWWRFRAAVRMAASASSQQHMASVSRLPWKGTVGTHGRPTLSIDLLRAQGEVHRYPCPRAHRLTIHHRRLEAPASQHLLACTAVKQGIAAAVFHHDIHRFADFIHQHA
jgi:hypothetical protein